MCQNIEWKHTQNDSKIMQIWAKPTHFQVAIAQGKKFPTKYGYYVSLDKIWNFQMVPYYIPLPWFIFSQIYHLWTRLVFSLHISYLFSVHGQNSKPKVSRLHGSFYTVSDLSKMPIFSRKSSQIYLNFKSQHFLLKFKATLSLLKIRILTVVTFLKSRYMEKSRGVPRDHKHVIPPPSKIFFGEYTRMWGFSS